MAASSTRAPAKLGSPGDETWQGQTGSTAENVQTTGLPRATQPGLTGGAGKEPTCGLTGHLPSAAAGQGKGVHVLMEPRRQNPSIPQNVCYILYLFR